MPLRTHVRQDSFCSMRRAPIPAELKSIVPVRLVRIEIDASRAFELAITSSRRVAMAASLSPRGSRRSLRSPPSGPSPPRDGRAAACGRAKLSFEGVAERPDVTERGANALRVLFRRVETVAERPHAQFGDLLRQLCGQPCSRRTRGSWRTTRSSGAPSRDRRPRGEPSFPAMDTTSRRFIRAAMLWWPHGIPPEDWNDLSPQALHSLLIRLV